MKTGSLRRWSVSLSVFFATAAVFSVSCLQVEAAEEKTDIEYWQGTGLSFERVKIEGITHSRCYAARSEVIFLGCLSALRALAAFQEPPAEIVLTKDLDGSRKPIHQSGILAIVPVVKSSEKTETALTLHKKELERKKKWTQTSRKVLSAGINATDLDSIFAFLAKMTPAEKRPLASGLMINTFYLITIDPHTYLRPTKQLEDEMNSPDTSFSGIGSLLQQLGSSIVMTPMESSPALQAGLRANDLLIKVDGIPVEEKALDAVVKMIRGPAGTIVTIEILRKEKPMTLKITRGPITTENVSSKIVQDRDLKVGFVKLGMFSDRKACDKIKTAVQELEKKGAQALILDFRGNGGGLLDQAICISGLFVGKNVIVRVKDLKEGSMESLSATNNAITTLPIVTLINAGSASASEIVAGALQDYARSWVVGERSFGKGSVQQGSSVSLSLVLFQTIQRFYQPSGRTNQVAGIEPDFQVSIKPNAAEEDRLALREADLYENALPPIGKPWVQPRPTEVATIQKCVEKTGMAARLYEERKDDALPPDYQLLAAQDIIACTLPQETSPLQ